jgi:heat shock transcription factor, other eukaryote
MQRNFNPLKRAAPGAAPPVPQNMSSYPVQDATQQIPNQADPQYFNWDQSGDFKAADLSGFDANDYAYNPAMMGNGQLVDQGALAPVSGELVRRNANQQLARQSRAAWDPAPVDVSGSGWVYDDDAELSVKAMEAKKDAQAKKRQIPPFVMKLSRYVSSRLKHDIHAN